MRSEQGLGGTQRGCSPAGSQPHREGQRRGPGCAASHTPAPACRTGTGQALVLPAPINPQPPRLSQTANEEPSSPGPKNRPLRPKAPPGSTSRSRAARSSAQQGPSAPGPQPRPLPPSQDAAPGHRPRPSARPRAPPGAASTAPSRTAPGPALPAPLLSAAALPETPRDPEADAGPPPAVAGAAQARPSAGERPGSGWRGREAPPPAARALPAGDAVRRGGPLATGPAPSNRSRPQRPPAAFR